jgi:isoleucyl-tRNA synthetase
MCDLTASAFGGGEFNNDKIAAYQTLYSCLETIALLSAPIAPFYSDKLFNDLNAVSKKYQVESVHHTNFPEYTQKYIDKSLEERMDIAQQLSSMILGLRRKVNLKVRQPLGKIMVPILDVNYKAQLEAIEELVLSEVNVKEMELLEDTTGVLVKKIKPNFKALGPRFGKNMKAIAAAINQFSQDDIATIEKTGTISLAIENEKIDLILSDVEITSEDIPGWLVATQGSHTVALDINLTDTLIQEGIARELINRIQNLRKDSGFEVTDKIIIKIKNTPTVDKAVLNFKDYISSQTLAENIELVESLNGDNAITVEIDENTETSLSIDKI